MKALKRFHEVRRRYLNDPVSEDAVGSAAERFGVSFSELAEMYRLFDGELGWGAWWPGYRIHSLADAISVYDGLNYDVEAFSGSDCFVSGFFPFISSSDRTDVGLVLHGAKDLNGQVLEYRAEDGNHRVMAPSLSVFFDAFLGLSIKLGRNLDDNVGYQILEFDDGHLNFLRINGLDLVRQWKPLG